MRINGHLPFSVSVDPRLKSAGSLPSDREIRDALDFCCTHRISQFVLALPFNVATEQILQLLQDPRIVGLVAKEPDQGLRNIHAHSLGTYLPNSYTWDLPPSSARTIVFVGIRSRVSFPMLKSAYLRGFRRIVCCTPIGWVNDSIVNLLFRRICSYAAAKAQRLSRPMPGAFTPPHVCLPKRLYARFLTKAKRFADSERDAVPGRVVLVNSGLAAGGAERQIVSTLKGLSEKGLEPILLCEDLFSRSGHDFFLDRVLGLEIPVREVHRGVKPAQFFKRISSCPDLLKFLDRMPCGLRDDILDLYFEFVALKPEVVHGWQDSTSIKVGMAATLAGVPHIVLSARNVSPPNFAYHQNYMKPAYQALSELHSVVFLNNSHAGAADYARWLGVPESRFTVIRNGIDFSSLDRARKDQVLSFRNQLGIPNDAPLVGSVFRYWPEKRPLLWIEMAAKIAAEDPDIHFLLLGWGPMRSNIERLATKLGLEGRFHLIEKRTDIATPVSAMDVFVLTSKHEGTPNVVLESQQLGVPVVVTNAGGTAEAIERGVTGWIVDPPSPIALAKQVLAILSDQNKVNLAKTGGPAFVKSTFAVDRMVKDTLTAYQITAPRRNAVESDLMRDERSPEERREMMPRFHRPAFAENHVSRVD